MSPWESFWRTVVRFQKEKLEPWMGLRNTIGVVVPVIAGLAFHAPRVGLAVATGALNVSFTDNHEPYPQRARRMLIGSALVGLAVFTGSMSGHSEWAAVFAAIVWAFAAGMMVALSTTAADMGTMSLVTMLVYVAVPLRLKDGASAGLLAVMGGVLQTSLAIALWPRRRYGPEAELLGSLYEQIASMAENKVDAEMAPPATAQSIQASASLAALDRDHSVEGERYRLLLSQAERARLGVLTLRRLRSRLRREPAGEAELALLDHFFELAGRALHAIGKALGTGAPVVGADAMLREISGVAEECRKHRPEENVAVLAMLQDAQFQMDALVGQIHAAVDLETNTTPAGLEAFRAKEVARPMQLRASGRVATLRANLTLKSTACRHAVRLAVCVAAGEALGQAIAPHLGLFRAYWIPMTIAIVLKPDFTATFSRGVLRLSGTLLGLVLSTALFHVLPVTPVTEVALVAFWMLVLRWIGPANYGIFVTAVTGLVVELIALNGTPPGQVMGARGLNTLLGGTLALLAYWVWPTWERMLAPEALAHMLDAYRDSFRTIRRAYQDPDGVDQAALDKVRGAARLARSTVEASIDRLYAEPGTPSDTVKALGAIMASSHRMVHALMAMEAGIGSVQARPGFGPFADAVELTLYYLASALRGASITRDMLPDIRARHHDLIQSGGEKYALVNVETDRITNSVNTMSAEVMDWLGRPTIPTSPDPAPGA